MKRSGLEPTAPRRARHALLAALAVAAAASACDDDLVSSVADAAAPPADSASGEVPDPGGSPPADAAEGGTDDVGAATNPGVGIAVVNSDYQSVSISLVDPATGALVKDDCINSGSRPPAPALSLSGDVILPSAPQSGGSLLVIDRTNAALTWVDPATCVPTRQLSVATGFGANPQDVLSLSPTKAYVTRNVRNGRATPDPGDFDEGDDILVIDPSVPAITGRIALGGHASPVTGVDIQARPDRALLANGKVYVTLSSMSGDYKAAGFGRIAVIDPATDAVVGMIDIPNLKACRAMSHEQATNTLIVACSGLYADGPAKASTSGIVWVDLGASPPAVMSTMSASAFGGRLLAFERNIVTLSETKGFVVSLGEFKGTPTDQLWLFDRTAGAPAKLADSVVSFEFGFIILDRVRNQLLLADAALARPRVRLFGITGDGLAPLSEVNVNPSRGLPPRYMGWY